MMMTDAEHTENIARTVFGRTLTEEDRKNLHLLLNDEIVNQEICRDVDSFLSNKRNLEDDRAIGEDMYERIMSRPGNKIPRYSPVDHRTDRPKNLHLGRVLLRVAAVLVPILMVSGALWLFLSDSQTEFTSGQLAKVSDIRFGDKGYDDLSGDIVIKAVDSPEEVIMPDGSVIKLQKGATLEYKRNFVDDRRVNLIGNAFFTVAKMTGKTFEVINDKMTIRVLGTEFFVHSRNTVKEVTLKSGSVEIETGDRSVMLKPNEQFVMNLEDNQISVHEISVAEMARIIRGKLEIRNELLPDALKKACDFFGMRVVIPKTLKGGGKVLIEFDENDNLEDVLFAIKSISNNAFDYQIGKTEVIIKVRK